MVEAELARMGPLAVAVAERATAPRRASRRRHDWKSGIAADVRHAHPRAPAQSRLLRDRHPDARDRHRRLHRGVQHRQRAAAADRCPIPNPEQLVDGVGDRRATTATARSSSREPVYEDWKRETRSFQSIGIWEYRTYNVASAQEPEQVQGIRATSSLFTVLGVAPALGRVFTAEEETPGHQRRRDQRRRVAQRILAAQPSAIGATMRLNGEPFEVIGVMPKGFEFPHGGNGVWVPFAMDGSGRAARLAFVLGGGAHAAGGDVRTGARRRRAGRPRAAAALRGEQRRRRDASR